MKSGGSSGKEPKNNPQPQGAPVTPYGQSTPFNPQYQSILPSDPLQTAQLGDPTTTESGPETPLLAQQQAVPMTQSAGGAAASPSAATADDPKRALLAALMAKYGQSPERGYNPTRDQYGVGGSM